MPELIEFYFATSNEHKITEGNAALSQFQIQVNKLAEFDKLEIQSQDLEKIASTALILILPKTRLPVFVEDSGLFIHELNGFPGPYSSYIFETLGIEGILKLMDGAHTRKAEFRSSVAFGKDGEMLGSFSSTTEGTIQLQARGKNGFGFDPIFVPMWAQKTFAEMELKEKTIYSHRSKALSKMALWYLNESSKEKKQMSGSVDRKNS